jgi:ADP-ribose pyrophosphatase
LRFIAAILCLLPHSERGARESTAANRGINPFQPGRENQSFGEFFKGFDSEFLILALTSVRYTSFPQKVYPMSHRLIEKQAIFAGSRIRLELHTMENEETSKRYTKEVVVHPGAVVILPFLNDSEILLIRNRRIALGGERLIELPAGTLEKGEDPINCAGRELVEETGYLAGRLQPLGNFFTSPGVLSEKIYAYAAYDLEIAKVDPDEGEEIETRPVAFDEAIEMIRDNRIHDGKTIATILMYDRFYRDGKSKPATAEQH